MLNKQLSASGGQPPNGSGASFLPSMDANMHNEREEGGTFENMTGMIEETGESIFK